MPGEGGLSPFVQKENWSDGQAASQPCHKPVALLSPHLPPSGQRKSVLDNLDKYSYIFNIATKRH